MEETDFSTPFGWDVWERMRVLDRYCDLSFGRYTRDQFGHIGKDPKNPNREWNVTIKRRDAKLWEKVEATKPKLRDAAIEAIEKAEKIGWHLPQPSAA